MAIINKLCQHCNNPFVDKSNRRRQKFCTNSCASQSRKKNIKLDNCKNCKKELDTYQYKFCCIACSAIFNNSIRSTESRNKQRKSLNKKLNDAGLSRSDPKDKFYKKCYFRQWKSDVWEKIPGFDLIASIGKFHPTRNNSGAVRDHLVTKFDAYINGYDPENISHPANCRIIPNFENITKGTQSSITYTELLERIAKW